MWYAELEALKQAVCFRVGFHHWPSTARRGIPSSAGWQIFQMMPEAQLAVACCCAALLAV